MKNMITSLRLTLATRVIVPTITFFDETGKIHDAANRLLIRHIIINRADCIFLMGSTGEGRFFADKIAEKSKYLELVELELKKMAKNLLILIGVYGEHPEDAIIDAQNCLKTIPQASLVIPPPVKTKLNPKAQIDFFAPILDQIHAPIYLYNNPDTFGGTEIAIETVNALKKYSNFIGLKDSSASDEQKKVYLTALSEIFTISCGKEGSLAKFLTFIPKEKRQIAGIIPSISNLVNTCARIFDLGITGKDAEMQKLQDELNSFREKIYDSVQSKGKAQRGTKIAFAHLYKDILPNIPIDVNPSLKREISPETIKSIKDQTDLIFKLGHITRI